MAHQADEAGLIAAYDASVQSLLNTADVFRKLFPNSDNTQSGHAGEEGRWTESLIAEFLRRNLPSSLEVATGFILDTASGMRSYQIDILIHDPTVAAPILRYGDAVVVMPEAVLGAISVKHTLRQKKLAHELRELSAIGRLCGRADTPGPYLALVGYQMDPKKSYKKFVKSINETYVKVFTELSERPERIAACEIVESVIALDGYLLHAAALAKEGSGVNGDKRKKVPVTWGGPGDRWRYALAVELIAGLSKRYHRREPRVKGRGWPSLAGRALSKFDAIPIACESRPPLSAATKGHTAPV
ncbi:DUF6602 domain-containing protein [Nocardia sp. N13]|uniref:DUF6602 domain-containing protein n=1 Tax=Nocardioides sp. N13(2025) TaxID=3453405 RepID=UPI003F759CFC